MEAGEGLAHAVPHEDGRLSIGPCVGRPSQRVAHGGVEQRVGRGSVCVAGRQRGHDWRRIHVHAAASATSTSASQLCMFALDLLTAEMQGPEPKPAYRIRPLNVCFLKKAGKHSGQAPPPRPRKNNTLDEKKL